MSEPQPSLIDPSKDILNYGGHDIILVETPLGATPFHRPPAQEKWFPFADVRPSRNDPRRGFLAQLEAHQLAQHRLVHPAVRVEGGDQGDAGAGEEPGPAGRVGHG